MDVPGYCQEDMKKVDFAVALAGGAGRAHLMRLQKRAGVPPHGVCRRHAGHGWKNYRGVLKEKMPIGLP